MIVGAGLAGAATAYHLRTRGVRDMVILEREPAAGVHSSGRNAAIVRESMEKPALQALASESAAVLRSGVLADFRACGGLLLDGRGDDASAHVPVAVGTGRHVATDGVVDVAALLSAYLAEADVRYGCALERFDTGDHGGVTLITSDGELRADVLVNAAGAWAGDVGRIDVQPTNRHLHVSEPDPGVEPTWPYIWDLEHEYYLRPESGGWLLCACDETPAAPGDYAFDDAAVEILAAKLEAHQPGLRSLRIASSWVGQRTFGPDRLPIVGFDVKRPGLYHVAGLGGHGVTLSWSVGRHAARELLGEAEAHPVLSPSANAPSFAGDP